MGNTICAKVAGVAIAIQGLIEICWAVVTLNQNIGNNFNSINLDVLYLVFIYSIARLIAGYWIWQLLKGGALFGLVLSLTTIIFVPLFFGLIELTVAIIITAILLFALYDPEVIEDNPPYSPRTVETPKAFQSARNEPAAAKTGKKGRVNRPPRRAEIQGSNTLLSPDEREAITDIERILGKSVPVVGNVDGNTFGYSVQEGHVTQLGLQNQGLESLPETLGNLVNLQTLFLQGNQLASLPETLGNLTSLQQLVLSRNQLTSLPETLGNLTSLQQLVLSRNQLTSLPEVLGHLSQLNDLRLYDNALSSLPETLLRINALANLHLDKRLAGDRVAMALEKRNVNVQEM